VDRVLASEAKGRWFDSSQPHQHFKSISTKIFQSFKKEITVTAPAAWSADVFS